jgi:hypothetical protein
MKITNHFPDGTTRSTMAGVRVPYTVNTAPAYQTLAAVSEKPRTRERPKRGDFSTLFPRLSTLLIRETNRRQRRKWKGF